MLTDEPTPAEEFEEEHNEIDVQGVLNSLPSTKEYAEALGALYRVTPEELPKAIAKAIAHRARVHLDLDRTSLDADARENLKCLMDASPAWEAIETACQTEPIWHHYHRLHAAKRPKKQTRAERNAWEAGLFVRYADLVVGVTIPATEDHEGEQVHARHLRGLIEHDLHPASSDRFIGYVNLLFHALTEACRPISALVSGRASQQAFANSFFHGDQGKLYSRMRDKLAHADPDYMRQQRLGAKARWDAKTPSERKELRRKMKVRYQASKSADKPAQSNIRYHS